MSLPLRNLTSLLRLRNFSNPGNGIGWMGCFLIILYLNLALINVFTGSSFISCWLGVFLQMRDTEKIFEFLSFPHRKIWDIGRIGYYFASSDFLSIFLQCCSPFPQFRAHLIQSVVVGQLVLSF